MQGGGWFGWEGETVRKREEVLGVSHPALHTYLTPTRTHTSHTPLPQLPHTSPPHTHTPKHTHLTPTHTHTTAHTLTLTPHPYTHTGGWKQRHFHLVYSLESCGRLCLSGGVDSTAPEASCLRARGHFDPQREEEFSDSFAYKIFFPVFLKDRGDVFISKNTSRGIYFSLCQPETKNFWPKRIL